MPKLFEDSLGPWEHVFLLAILVGVIYLVFKTAKLKLNVGYTEGMFSHSLPYQSKFSSTNQDLSDYGTRSEVFSVGGYEPPVFHMTPYDSNEMNQVSEVRQDNSHPPSSPAKSESFVPKTGYGAAAHRQGFQSDLEKSLSGGNVQLF